MQNSRSLKEAFDFFNYNSCIKTRRTEKKSLRSWFIILVREELRQISLPVRFSLVVRGMDKMRIRRLSFITEHLGNLLLVLIAHVPWFLDISL